MADAIDVVVRDKISRSIESKLLRIGQNANVAAAGIANLNNTLANSGALSSFSTSSTRAARNVTRVTQANQGLLASLGGLIAGFTGYNGRLTATDRILMQMRNNVRATGQSLRSFA